MARIAAHPQLSLGWQPGGLDQIDLTQADINLKTAMFSFDLGHTITKGEQASLYLYRTVFPYF